MFIRLPAAQIDKKAWDACIQQDPAGVVYALSWYLDLVAPDWEGLVVQRGEAYRLVMPLPTRRLVGLPVIAMPVFGQQLGIFTNEPILMQNQLPALLTAAFPTKRPVEHYCFRPIDFERVKTLLPLTARPNLILPLHSPYDDIYAGYQPNRRRDLKKAAAARLTCQEGDPCGPAIVALLKDNLAPRLKKRQRTAALQIMPALMHAAAARGLAKMAAVYTRDNQLIAGAFFLRYQNRLTYLLPAATALGKKVGASTFLLDQICRREAGSALTLDFEGSNVPGIARFYESFGAQPEPYGLLQNYPPSLPLYLRLKVKNWLTGNLS